ncbi:hypothetical protein BD410DRAFT_367209 [Rickenella mellea]|uniref:t-SNARE coiled-coil homology domain-containing protein n=1 Tax=Rickenella mellea TaxID=50990 RepID=A0A4Y7Q128_9AGAM|nr:hypothetical protein BD410DRAFT_367209 [Rickenella mellea]
MSLAKLTSLSTQTLSLLLERQRLQTMSSGPGNANMTKIVRNMEMLRNGVLALDDVNGGGGEGQKEAVRLLKSQHERMRGMLGDDADGWGVKSLEAQAPSKSESSSPTPTPPPKTNDGNGGSDTSGTGLFAPYSDDPSRVGGEGGSGGDDNERSFEPNEVMQQQQYMIREQDTQLDHLSRSIGRQHHISLQINDELDVHTGLLEELDVDLDRTGGRLGGARRRLDVFARGVKGNGSTYAIALLILVLLILIIVFKT